MTDDMRVGLVAVAMAQGVGVDAAWELVDRVADEVGDVDARRLAREVSERAGTQGWTGSGGRVSVG